MIETALVYIYSVTPSRQFEGCGALIEGDWVATCRHVWRSAVAEVDQAAEAQRQIEMEFPFAEDEKGKPRRSRAVLVDECMKLGGKPPDLVLIEPSSIPDTVARLRLATHERFETGKGYAHVGLIGLDKTDPGAIFDRLVSGQIRQVKDARGLRQFTGDNLAAYWSQRGASGSPVFVEGGEQLAGILSLSEVGVNEGKSTSREAAILPATTIRLHLAWAEFDRTGSQLGLNAKNSQLLLKALLALGAPLPMISRRLEWSLEQARARASMPISTFGRGADIDAAITAARAKMSHLDVVGAIGLLDAKIAKDERAQSWRVVPLLCEKAQCARVIYDYETAKATLRRALEIEPNSIESWIYLGDIEMTIGSLDAAMQIFRDALAEAERLSAADPARAFSQRDLSILHQRVATILAEQGDSAGSVKWGRSAEELARADLGSRGSRRDASASYDRFSSYAGIFRGRSNRFPGWQ